MTDTEINSLLYTLAIAWVLCCVVGASFLVPGFAYLPY